jgi:hypothetical protein
MPCVTGWPSRGAATKTSILRLDIAERDHAIVEDGLGMGDFGPSPGTTIFRLKPKAVQSQSMAAAPFR